jgi:hypothetical protein
MQHTWQIQEINMIIWLKIFNAINNFEIIMSEDPVLKNEIKPLMKQFS